MSFPCSLSTSEVELSECSEVSLMETSSGGPGMLALRVFVSICL